jgi:hypothetical protein
VLNYTRAKDEDYPALLRVVQELQVGTPVHYVQELQVGTPVHYVQDLQVGTPVHYVQELQVGTSIHYVLAYCVLPLLPFCLSVASRSCTA